MRSGTTDPTGGIAGGNPVDSTGVGHTGGISAAAVSARLGGAVGGRIASDGPPTNLTGTACN